MRDSVELFNNVDGIYAFMHAIPNIYAGCEFYGKDSCLTLQAG